MTEDGATVEVQDPTANEAENTQVTMEQFTQLQSQLELERKQRSSLDSKVSEYQKMLKEKEEALETVKNSNLSESEKLKLDFEKLQMEMQSEKAERRRATNKAKALELMSEKGIDKRYLDFIPLDDSEAMIEKLNGLSLIASDVMAQGAQSVVNKLGGGNIPAGGAVPSSGTITIEQYKSLSEADRAKAFKQGRIQGFGN